MTGRDLILYILENHLEETPVFYDGKFIGFMTESEAAEKWDVGIETIRTWYNLGVLKGVDVCGELYIPAKATLEFNR